MLLITLSLSSYAFTARMVMIHIVPHAIDNGITAANAALVAAAIGGFGIVGRLAMGFTPKELALQELRVDATKLLTTT